MLSVNFLDDPLPSSGFRVIYLYLKLVWLSYL